MAGYVVQFKEWWTNPDGTKEVVQYPNLGKFPTKELARAAMHGYGKFFIEGYYDLGVLRDYNWWKKSGSWMMKNKNDGSDGIRLWIFKDFEEGLA